MQSIVESKRDRDNNHVITSDQQLQYIILGRRASGKIVIIIIVIIISYINFGYTKKIASYCITNILSTFIPLERLYLTYTSALGSGHVNNKSITYLLN